VLLPAAPPACEVLAPPAPPRLIPPSSPDPPVGIREPPVAVPASPPVAGTPPFAPPVEELLEPPPESHAKRPTPISKTRPGTLMADPSERKQSRTDAERIQANERHPKVVRFHRRASFPALGPACGAGSFARTPTAGRAAPCSSFERSRSHPRRCDSRAANLRTSTFDVQRSLHHEVPD
jgi:hypothetical protein